MPTIGFLLSLMILPNTILSFNNPEKKKLMFYSRVIEALSQTESKEYLNKLFLDPRVKFNSKLILLNLDQPSQKHYFQLSLKNDILIKGKQFIKKYQNTFDNAERLYDVDKEVIVAILYIETNFNLSRATYNVFNAYVNLTFANHPFYLNLNLERLKKKYKDSPKKELEEKEKKFLIRSKEKAEWATEQLLALFQVAKKMKLSVLNIKGSFAGAMGYPQFIPSSYLKYAVDGDGDGFIDLYNIHDSIASVANYLKSVGFKKGNKESQEKAVYDYNHSHDYVDFVLEYANKLKKMK